MTNSFGGLPELLCLTDDAAEVAKFNAKSAYRNRTANGRDLNISNALCGQML